MTSDPVPAAGGGASLSEPAWLAEARRAIQVRVAADATPSTAMRYLALVQDQPGITIRQAARRLGLSHATSTYHLGRLVLDGHLARVRDGREVRFFPAGQHTPSTYLRALLADPRKRRIAELLREPGAQRLTLNEMARVLGIRFGYLKRTLQQLERSSLVRLDRHGSRYFVRPLDALLATLAAEAPGEAAPAASAAPAGPSAPARPFGGGPGAEAGAAGGSQPARPGGAGRAPGGA
jgi:DNA-binding MarR family transcriptional regulator